MANSAATSERSSNFRGLARDVFEEITFLSDDADGSIPDVELIGLDDCRLAEYRYAIGGTPPTSAFEIRIEDADGYLLYLSGSIAATADSSDIIDEPPFMDKGVNTIKFVDPADHTSACDVGNAKNGSIKLRFEKKTE